MHLVILLSYCSSIQPFRYVFGSIFLFNIVPFLLHPVVGMFCYNLLQIVNRIFFLCFRMSFLSVFFHFCRYLFNLPSFVSILWFIPPSCIVIFSCVAFSFFFLHSLASFLCFIILVCFRRFFYLHFQSNFPSWSWFFLCAFWGDPIFSQTNFSPA